MRRLLAAGAAILMALVGAMILLTYVHGADQRANARALSGVQTAPVLVATGVITKDTPAEKLATLVAVKQLPKMAIASGAVTDVKALSGKVALIDIQPGEQLLTSRFVDPNVAAAEGDVKVPDGMEQISVLMPLERVVGGLVTPGSHVGVFRVTTMVADKVLVTHLQVFNDATGPKAASSSSSPQPAADVKSPDLSDTSKILVTLAMTPAQAQAFVTGAEAGNQSPGELWLSLDKSDKGNADAH